MREGIRPGIFSVAAFYRKEVKRLHDYIHQLLFKLSSEYTEYMTCEICKKQVFENDNYEMEICD